MRVLHVGRLELTLSAMLLAIGSLCGEVCLGANANTANANTSGVAGQAFDATPFAVAVGSEDDGKAYEARWGEPRKIQRLEIEFSSLADLPNQDDVQVQYWHSKWDGKADPIEAEIGACEAGWDDPVDDWTRGKWKDADVHVAVDGRHWNVTFESSGAKEFPKVGEAGVFYRKTLKIRLVAKKPLPKIQRFAAFTEAVYRPLTVRIFWDKPAAASLQFDGANPGRLEVFNGVVQNVRSCTIPDASARVDMGDDLHWTQPAGVPCGIEADLLMAVDPVDGRYDRTIVTVRTRHNPFSFAADEAAQGERILVNDLGALTTRGDEALTVEGYRQLHKQFRGKTVYDRVSEADEQTLSRAWNDMPLKPHLWASHGLPGNRNAVRQGVNGSIEITSTRKWFLLPHSTKDTDRKDWPGDEFLVLDFGFPSENLRASRELLEGYIPWQRTTWIDGPIFYEQCTVLDKLDSDLSHIQIDDPTVMLMRVRVVNTSGSGSGVAHLHLTSHALGKDPPGQVEKLVVEGDQVLAAGSDRSRFRYLLKTCGQGTLKQAENATDWSMELAPGQSQELLFLIPSITLNQPEEIESLRKRDFSADSRRICDFWRNLTDSCSQIQTPEPWLNAFYKSMVRHLEINCVRDPSAPRRYARIGTFHYAIYPNESIMETSELDHRGSHQAAEECLQTFLDFQGTVPLPGNFKSTTGLFFGAGGYQRTGYNKNHGYVMWGMADHWRFTRDRDWMERVAPKLIQACDWITNERKSTMKENNGGDRPIEYGFLPAGQLEDVSDYWYYLATNVNTVWGFDALAAALADFGHPEAARLQQDAKAYHDDVMRGLTESRIRSPVVRLRDGTYVPKYPSQLHVRGRSQGWIRETLEGSLFLLIDGLIPADSPEASWIVKGLRRQPLHFGPLRLRHSGVRSLLVFARWVLDASEFVGRPGRLFESRRAEALHSRVLQRVRLGVRSRSATMQRTFPAGIGQAVR